MKKLLQVAVLTMIAMFSTNSAIADLSFPKPTGYVNDYANLISAEKKATMEQALRDYDKRTSAEIVIVTVPDMGGYDVKDYSVQLAKAWKIGKKNVNNGVLILLAKKERKIRIEVAYGLESVITDDKSFDIIRGAMKPKFKNNDWAGGLMAGANEIMSAIDKSKSSTAVPAATTAAQATTGDSSNANPSGAILLFLLAIGSLAAVAFIIHLIRKGLSERKEEMNDALSRYTRAASEAKATLAKVESMQHGGYKLDQEKIQSAARRLKMGLTNAETRFNQGEYKNDPDKMVAASSEILEAADELAARLRRIQALCSDNMQGITRTSKSLVEISSGVSTARKAIEELNNDWPEISTDKLTAGLEEATKLLSTIPQLISEATKLNAFDGNQDIDAAEKVLSTIKEHLSDASRTIEEPAKQLSKIKTAKNSVPELEKEISEISADVTKALAAGKISSHVKELAKKANAKYAEAQELMKGSTNWLLIATSLAAVMEIFEETMLAIRREAEPVRSHNYGNPQRRSSGGSSSSRKRDDDDNRSSSTYIGSSSESYGGSSGSDSSGGYSGGGGDFGGGGSDSSF